MGCRYVYLMDQKQLVYAFRRGKTEKIYIYVKNMLAHMHAPSSTGQQIGRPVAQPVKSTGRPTEMAGRSVWSPCLKGFAVNAMGRVGPRNEKNDGTGRTTAHVLKNWWAVPGRGPSNTYWPGFGPSY